MSADVVGGLFSLRGRVAVVTGSTRGLGRAIAAGLAAAGAGVVVVGRSHEQARQVADEIVAAGDVAIGVGADLTDDADLDRIVANAVGQLGGLDILVNNAGEYRHVLAEDVDAESFDEVFAINTRAPLLLAARALPHLRASGHGSIVNVLSAAVWVSEPGGTLYRASKSALLAITMSLATGWAQHGVRSNAVAPGAFESEMMDGMSERSRRAATAGTPLRRFGRPDELVPAVLYLASDASSYVTGEVLRVDGGLVSR